MLVVASCWGAPWAHEIAEDDANELFHSENSCTNHDCRIGEYSFCEAIKVDMAESEDKCQKIIPIRRRISIQAHSQAPCVCFAHYLKIKDVLLNCMRK
jgi:hypothetical protein